MVAEHAPGQASNALSRQSITIDARGRDDDDGLETRSYTLLAGVGGRSRLLLAMYQMLSIITMIFERWIRIARLELPAETGRS